ncbi:MAG: MBOAT family protein [Chitinophagales bacterium]
MMFNSVDFAIFLSTFFGLYWFVAKDNLKIQNLLIVIGSYLFYGLWDWRFLFLIFLSSVVDYSVGRKLEFEANQVKRKILLWSSIVVNLGILGFFKYYNFFLENFIEAFSFFGQEIQGNSLNIILPVGISFYTFQTLSYTIDVYKRKLKPTKDFIVFSAFVSFFPQLVAGPIERATNLLPQFFKKRTFSYEKAADGMRQILWGLFKKIVIADNCAEYANLIFNHSDQCTGSTLVVGAVFFTFQIYGDFSGYSDIAIGTARLLGFDLKKNFSFPFFSRDIAEFWRRWHISLTTWFRDYLYIPLGGSRRGTFMKIRNTFIIFLVSGFWHGANWTFIVWGLLHATFFLPLLLFKRNRKHLDIVAKGKIFPSFREFVAMLSTFGLTVFAFIFFRANDIGHAISYISEVFSPSLFTTPDFIGMMEAIPIAFLVVLFILIEWIGREGEYAIEGIGLRWWRPLRYGLYYAIIGLIFLFGNETQEFIYFQF